MAADCILHGSQLKPRRRLGLGSAVEFGLDAEFLHQLGEMGGDFFRAIAIGAQVTEDDVIHGGMRDVADQFIDLKVGKVAVARSDALFDRPRAFGVAFEEFIVVVRFDEQG